MAKYNFETCERCGGTGGLPTGESLRLRRGKVSQAVMADRMGITQQYLSALEMGKRQWNYGLVEEFEKALKKGSR